MGHGTGARREPQGGPEAQAQVVLAQVVLVPGRDELKGFAA
jgi:hypothetical protein